MVDKLIHATSTVMDDQPGFVSASIHKSADGVRVTNYAQWRTARDFEAMLQNPQALEHMKPILEIATNDAHLYDVVDTFTVDD